MPRLLTGGTAYYRIYETADGRHLTVGALEPKFFARLCELVGRPDLAERQFDPDQEALAAELAAVFAARPLDEWLVPARGRGHLRGPRPHDRRGCGRIRRPAAGRSAACAGRAHGPLEEGAGAVIGALALAGAIAFTQGPGIATVAPGLRRAPGHDRRLGARMVRRTALGSRSSSAATSA